MYSTFEFPYTKTFQTLLEYNQKELHNQNNQVEIMNRVYHVSREVGMPYLKLLFKLVNCRNSANKPLFTKYYPKTYSII